MTRLFTLPDAARVLRTHTIVLYRAIRAGRLHGVQVPGRQDWFVREDCLGAWLDRTACQHPARGADLKAYSGVEA